jgi:hypothetical protein
LYSFCNAVGIVVTEVNIMYPEKGTSNKLQFGTECQRFVLSW